MKGLVRGLAWVVVPLELALVVCLLVGASLPTGVLVGVEAVALALLAVEGVALAVVYRRGGRAALRDIVPEPVRRIVGHELRVMWSLALWVARRRHGVREGDLAFGHARDQAAMLYGLVFVCVVETVGMAVLLRSWPAVHAVMLVVDVYTVILMLGVHAASVTRPHVLSADSLRVRHGAHRDLRIPLELISAARGERRFTHEATDGVLDIPVAAQTSLTLELTAPVTAVGFLGGRRQVTTVRLHSDEPESLRAALTQAGAALTQARAPLTQARAPLTQARAPLTQARAPLTQARSSLTQARTAPSPTRGSPA